MSDDAPGISRMDAQALSLRFNMLRMFVMLSVPEPRRGAVLSLLRRMVESHSLVAPDDSPAIDDAMLQAIDEMREIATSLDRFELVDANAPDDPPQFRFSSE